MIHDQASPEQLNVMNYQQYVIDLHLVGTDSLEPRVTRATRSRLLAGTFLHSHLVSSERLAAGAGPPVRCAVNAADDGMVRICGLQRMYRFCR